MADVCTCNLIMFIHDEAYLCSTPEIRPPLDTISSRIRNGRFTRVLRKNIIVLPLTGENMAIDTILSISNYYNLLPVRPHLPL